VILFTIFIIIIVKFIRITSAIIIWLDSSDKEPDEYFEYRIFLPQLDISGWEKVPNRAHFPTTIQKLF